jgi:hypothetical protein
MRGTRDEIRGDMRGMPVEFTVMRGELRTALVALDVALTRLADRLKRIEGKLDERDKRNGDNDPLG